MRRKKLRDVLEVAANFIYGGDSVSGYDQSEWWIEDGCIAEQVIAMLWGLA